jgi:hypothetical protein
MPALLFFVLLLIIWQATVTYFELPFWLLPSSVKKLQLTVLLAYPPRSTICKNQEKGYWLPFDIRGRGAAIAAPRFYPVNL